MVAMLVGLIVVGLIVGGSLACMIIIFEVHGSTRRCGGPARRLLVGWRRDCIGWLPPGYRRAAICIPDFDPQPELAFSHSILCQVGLPYRKVEGQEYLRRNGRAWLHVQAGMVDNGAGPVRQPIPYGAMPRLVLSLLSTHALRHDTPEVFIGRSQSEFLRLMGLDDQGARYKTLRVQLPALASCRLQMGFQGRTINSQPVQQFDAWMAPGNTIVAAAGAAMMKALGVHVTGALPGAPAGPSSTNPSAAPGRTPEFTTKMK